MGTDFRTAVLSAFLEILPKIKFIQTDRLVVRDEDAPVEKDGDYLHFPRPLLMVERLSREIQTLVQEADRNYRLISTQLDSSLRNRIFHTPVNPPSLEELVERNKALRENEARLQSLGLLRESSGAMEETILINEQQRGIFDILLNDFTSKLAPFADLASKTERLLKSLNAKLAPKQVRLDLETGYQVITTSGEPLHLGRLSSGEQHQLVLHEALFDLEPGTLILIDEPELSLHVAWQEALVPELLEIAQLAQLDFVLATHSPFIVGDDHADLMVRLGEPLP